MTRLPLRDFLDQYADDTRRVDQVLLSAPNFTEDVVLRLFAEAFGMPYFDEIDAEKVPQVFIENIPAPYAQHHSVIGLNGSDDGSVIVITSSPLNATVVDNVSKMLHQPVETALSTRAAITAAIDIAYEQKIRLSKKSPKNWTLRTSTNWPMKPPARRTCSML